MIQIACVMIGPQQSLCAPTFEKLVALFAQEKGIDADAARALLLTSWWAQEVEAKPRGFAATMSQLVSGVSAVFNDVIGNVVPEAEARRRAAICVGCEWRSDTTDCTSCDTYAKVREYLPRSLPQIHAVSALGCGVCHCSCAVMVWARPEAFKRDALQHPDRPERCWVKHLSWGQKNP